MCYICKQTFCPSGCPNALSPKPIGKCAICGIDVFQFDFFKICGDFVCGECENDYYLGFANEFSSRFVAHNLDFYMDYFFNNLHKSDKLKLLEDAYNRCKHDDDFRGKVDFCELERDFCLESDGFAEFVKARLN